jgi:hypothetical protein
VLALGSITAGEDALFMRVRLTGPTLKQRTEESHVYPPLRIAKVFFERAKSYLGDVFETSSLESTQALFLMVSPLTIDASLR